MPGPMTLGGQDDAGPRKADAPELPSTMGVTDSLNHKMQRTLVLYRKL